MGVMGNLSLRSERLKHFAAKLRMLGYEVNNGNSWSFIFWKNDPSNTGLMTEYMSDTELKHLDYYKYKVFEHFVFKAIPKMDRWGRDDLNVTYNIFVENPKCWNGEPFNYFVDFRFLDYEDDMILVYKYDINSCPIYYILDKNGNVCELFEGDHFPEGVIPQLRRSRVVPGCYELCYTDTSRGSLHALSNVSCYIRQKPDGTLDFKIPGKRKKAKHGIFG